MAIKPYKIIKLKLLYFLFFFNIICEGKKNLYK